MKRTILASLLALSAIGAAHADDDVMSFVCGNDYVQARAVNHQIAGLNVNNVESQNVDLVHQAKNGVAYTNIYAMDTQAQNNSGWVLTTSSLGSIVFSHVQFDYPVTNPYKFKVVGKTVRCTGL